MNETRKVRLIYVVALSLGIVAASILLIYAFVANAQSFCVPTEIKVGDCQTGEVIKVGGYVVENSIDYTKGSTVTRFLITDATEENPDGELLAVTYDDLMPNLFEEGLWVVAEGRYENGVFTASHIMAKHDESYVSPSATDEKLQARIEKAKAHREAIAAEVQKAADPQVSD